MLDEFRVAVCVPYGYNEGEPVREADFDALVATLGEAVRVAMDACTV